MHAVLLNDDVLVEPGCVRRSCRPRGEPVRPRRASTGHPASRSQAASWSSCAASAGTSTARATTSAAPACASRGAPGRPSGPFDEELFLYYEDVDWCLRARALGVPLTVALDARATHSGGASSGGDAGRDVGLLLHAQPALAARAAARCPRRTARGDADEHARPRARAATGAPRRRARAKLAGVRDWSERSYGTRPVAPLKVAFDVACLTQTRAGTARLAIGLRDALRARDDVELVELGGQRVEGARLDRPEARRAAAGSRLVRPAARQGGARPAARRCCTARPSAGRSARPGLPTVVTVHDLAVLREPSWFPTWSRNYGRTLMPRAVRNADRVICVSRATARDAVGLLDVPVRQPARDPERDRARVLDACPGPRRSSRPTCCASARPSRARTCRRCSRRSRSSAARGGECASRSSAPTAGATCAWAPPRASSRSAASTTAELRDLYAHAEALVLPSLWEGFGLPVAEALATGCRVACSDIPRPARAGRRGRARTSTPTTPEAIAEGILLALTQPRPIPRRGASWDDVAASVVGLWRELVHELRAARAARRRYGRAAGAPVTRATQSTCCASCRGTRRSCRSRAPCATRPICRPTCRRRCGACSWTSPARTGASRCRFPPSRGGRRPRSRTSTTSPRRGCPARR